MAHQFSTLHPDSFVTVSHATRERLREVNMLALGLITEMTAHIDGYPVKLDTIIKKAKKPGAAAMRDAYQDLIAERLVVYVQYTLQLPGKRPYPSGTTVIAKEAISDDEFTEHVVAKYRPGQTVLDQQADGEVRKVKVLSARVRYWGGERKITDEGELAVVPARAKPGPKKGSRTGQQPPPAGSVVEPGQPSSTTTSENAEPPQKFVEPDEPGSTTTSENAPFSQRNVEPGVVESTSPSSLTRTREQEHQPHQDDVPTAAESAPTASSQPGDGGWVGSSHEQKKTLSGSPGAQLLRSLRSTSGDSLSSRAVTEFAADVDGYLAAGHTEQAITHHLTAGIHKGGGIRTKLVQLRNGDDHLLTPVQQPPAMPPECGQCDSRHVEDEHHRPLPCPRCNPKSTRYTGPLPSTAPTGVTPSRDHHGDGDPVAVAEASEAFMRRAHAAAAAVA